MGTGREFTQGPGTSGVQGPACRSGADRRANRQPEERPRRQLATPQMPRLLINWEGLALGGPAATHGGWGSPQGAALCQQDGPHLLSAYCLPGLGFRPRMMGKQR